MSIQAQPRNTINRELLCGVYTPISCRTDASSKYIIIISSKGNKSTLNNTGFTGLRQGHEYSGKQRTMQRNTTHLHSCEQEISTENLLCCTWYSRDSAVSEMSKTWIWGTAINNITTALEPKLVWERQEQRVSTAKRKGRSKEARQKSQDVKMYAVTFFYGPWAQLTERLSRDEQWLSI